MRRVVAVILDGLRRDFVGAEFTPFLAGMRHSARWFAKHTSTTPSVTRVCSSSFTTGCFPAGHGIEGNSLALRESDGFAVYDTGRPEFLQHRRLIMGRALDRPSLAERLQKNGGSIVYSNVSPGAAYAHDPDGFGFVFHRAGTLGSGLSEPDTQPIVTPDLAGDRIMTARFIADALTARSPSYALLWLGDPDHTQHDVPLGSHHHLEALRSSDECVSWIFARVQALREAGDDVLFIVGSDHGHQTVHSVVDVESEISRLGFEAPIRSGDLVVVPNGTAVLIYMTGEGRRHLQALADDLGTLPWVGRVLTGVDLEAVGQIPDRGLSIFVSMASDDGVNEFGIPGRSFAAQPRAGKPDRLGNGQHGGLGTYEQSPFLMIDGSGFDPKTSFDAPTSLVDLAPTVLRHLKLDHGAMDGTPL